MDITSRRPGPGNGWTYTSARPDWLDSYARYRPSGDSSADGSSAALTRNGRMAGAASPSVNVQMSRLGFAVEPPRCRKTSVRPSGDHELANRSRDGSAPPSLPAIGSASPPPSAPIEYRFPSTPVNVTR